MASGWNDDFTHDSGLNSGLFPMRWGNSSEFSFGSGGLTLTSNGNSVGFMARDEGAGDGDGYGVFSATFSMPTHQANGAYICLWPSSNNWPGPEIDLAEQYNGQPYLTVHWKDSSGGNDYQAVDFNADLSRPTTVSLNWQASGLTFDVNGSQVADFQAGGRVPVPKDYADGGQNESFGVGNYGPAGTSLTVSDMSYTPSTQSGAPVAPTPTPTPPAPTPPTPTPPAAGTNIALSSPGMHFIANPSAGADAQITISDPGLKEVYAFVMSSHNVAESNWIDIPLNSAGQATHDFHFQHSGDYVLATNDPAAQTDRGFSDHITILQSS